jgi:fused signal recognition particle receptor
MAYIWLAIALIAVVAGVIAISRRRQVFDEPDDETGAPGREPSYEEETEAIDAAMAPKPVPEPDSQPAGGLGARVRSLFSGGTGTTETWSQLEDLLIRADVGPTASKEIVEHLKERVGQGADPEEALTLEVASLVSGGDAVLDIRHDGQLTIIMVVGVNGSGKTTTIGKLAAMLAEEGKTVALAASDTFRAAAGEQLDIWASRTGARLIAGERGADPGSVAFDAAKSATAKGEDVLIVDTAGRLHTRTPLMDELAKVKRVLEKASGDVEEILLVLDATTGQNGIAQTAAFTKAVGVTGVVLTKMDGTAKGGIVLAVIEELGVPVKFVGTGEGAADLEAFDARAFAERLVSG